VDTIVKVTEMATSTEKKEEGISHFWDTHRYHIQPTKEHPKGEKGDQEKKFGKRTANSLCVLPRFGLKSVLED